MCQKRKITAVPKPGESIRGEYERFLVFAAENEWQRLSVLFGWHWGLDIYERDWIAEVLSPSELQERVAAVENDKLGSIGGDDLIVTIEGHETKFTFCHENDIHIEGAPDDPILVAELDRYRSLGWTVYDRVAD